MRICSAPWGRTGGLFRGWLHYSGSLMPGGKISRHDTELIILRVAHLRDCGYEMDHHIRLGRKAGIDAEELARIIEGPGASELSPRHRAILTAVDELVTTKDVTDDTWGNALAASRRSSVDRIHLVGHSVRRPGHHDRNLAGSARLLLKFRGGRNSALTRRHLDETPDQ